ncbi:protein MIX23-like [Mytilus edulis]|uniref:Protein MIX23 n=1 Tax=Mytilus edulis TaxID=6550 RepID=A0A8S3SNC3_MYTED|nr:Coiled-coil domain-containing protein 58 [Mytilus edulis]
MAAPSGTVSSDVQTDYCNDFLQFNDILRRMRDIDDKIIYELNNTIPTKYFAKELNITDQCKSFYEQLDQSHRQRRSMISRCVTEASAHVNERKKEQQSDRDNVTFLKNLRKEQKKLHLVQQQVNIEEVIRDRTIKAYYERCRNAYKPPLDEPPVV